MSRQFRNGEDIAVVVSKLQSMALDGGDATPAETGPGEVESWDFVNPRAVYDEYVASPYQNYRMPVQV